jgi:hypothetical protein
LTEIQKQNRLAFAQRELENPRDWSRVLFTDESYFWLGEDRRFLWRRLGERGPDVELQTMKFGKKVMIFAGLSVGYKTPIIAITRGIIDGDSYVDECIDQSGLICDMNQLYGPFQWTLMQDGAPAHTKASTLEYLAPS